MTPDEAIEVIRSQHHAVLATTRSDGGVQMSPVAVVPDGGREVIISSRETAVKVKNLRRKPHAAVCVFPDTFFGGTWVQVEGPVRIESMPEAMETLVRYYKNLVGEHPDWDEYREAMVREQRVVIRITVERAGPNQQG
jgi:PPOX class probable F420-dependent enzyme